MKMTGAKRHRQRLKRLRGQALVAELGKRVFVAAGKVEAEAKVSIARGAVQGKGHVPSKPGDPPNLDTGVLTGGITARRTGPLRAEAESGAPYAVALEIGTSRMEARPYMAPAARTVREDYTVNIRAGVNRVIRKG